MKIDDEITFIHHSDDKPFLKSKLFDVNMRLFRSSPKYRDLINHCCANVKNNATTHFEDYKDPHGMSGANCAIPFNIIGIVRHRGKFNQYVQIMINPVRLECGGKRVSALSNCGSIRLKEPIVIKRREEVKVHWFDENGNPRSQWFNRSEGALTIQHEIDHNLGILITDIEQ